MVNFFLRITIFFKIRSDFMNNLYKQGVPTNSRHYAVRFSEAIGTKCLNTLILFLMSMSSIICPRARVNCISKCLKEKSVFTGNQILKLIPWFCKRCGCYLQLELLDCNHFYPYFCFKSHNSSMRDTLYSDLVSASLW